MNHVCDHGAGRSMQSAFLGIVRVARYYNLIVLQGNTNQRRERPLKFALGAFYVDIRTLYIYLHTGWNIHG
jgi:hypothetical protein